MKPVGISILTNGRRRDCMERCVDSLLRNCYFRPLVIGVMNNGSLDDTSEWMQNLPSIYGVEWRVHSSDIDHGCAWGTNKSIELVKDCEFQLHLESDFEHLEEDESGVDKMWLHRAIELLQSGECDYLYLRRMRGHNEAAMHWWAQWMPRITEERGEFLSCPSFWWSNNPAVFRTQALFDGGTLPLDVGADGPKGSNAWSVPELGTKGPRKPWIHRWGMFVHERQDKERFNDPCCGAFGPYGHSGCKYGFLASPGDKWCGHCDPSEGFADMVKHQQRYRHQRAPHVSSSVQTVAFHLNQLGYRGTDVGSWNYAKYNEELLGNRSVFLAPSGGKTFASDRFSDRFLTFFYESWEEAEEWLANEKVDILHMRKSGENDGLVSRNCKTVVHCALHAREEHGDVYCYISEWLSRKMSAGRLPWIPHIVEQHSVAPSMRDELGIPESAKVFGWMGGPETFNLQAGRNIVERLSRGNIWFVFMGIPKFADSPQAVFLSAACDDWKKSRFIYTCDAMLHARAEGETFGLAVAEFSAACRPVVTWNGGIGQAHLDMLGDKAILYHNENELERILTHWDHEISREWDVYTRRFEPLKVMDKFKKVCGL